MTKDDVGAYIYWFSKENVYRFHQSGTMEPTHIVEVKDADLRTITCHNNNLYFCDGNNHKILRYELDAGNLSTLAGTGQKGHKDGDMKEAEFCYPHGITVNKNGDLFVTDDHHIRKINLSEGTVITIAGQVKQGHANGPAKSAKFNIPTEIVARGEKLYIADYHNHCVRKIEDDIVSTVAGTPLENEINSIFDWPLALQLDIHGNLIVGDNDGVKMYNPSNKQLGVVPLPSPRVNCSDVEDTFAFLEHNGSLFVAFRRKLYLLEHVWNYERYLWIGHLKEEASYCLLATLPRDIVKEIARRLCS